MPFSRSGALGSAPVLTSAHSNPIRLAWKLARQRRVRRLFAGPGWVALSITALMLLGGLIAYAAWQQLRMHGAFALSPLLAHPIATATFAAAVACSLTMRSRRRIERQIERSWLATAPVRAFDRASALRWRAGIEVATPMALMIAMIACAGLASGTSVVVLCAAMTAGAAAGASAGWYYAAKPPRDHVRAGPRLRPARTATGLAARLTPLERLPFAQLLALANPHTDARIIGFLLLSLPAGIPPLIALLIIAFAANALVSFLLLRASLATIFEAASWLHATPLGLGAFARAVCWRTGVWQIICAVVGGALVFAQGASPIAASVLVLAWLVTWITATASALACRHHPSRLVYELVGTAALLVALMSIEPIALVAAVPAVWLWQIMRMHAE